MEILSWMWSNYCFFCNCSHNDMKLPFHLEEEPHYVVNNEHAYGNRLTGIEFRINELAWMFTHTKDPETGSPVLSGHVYVLREERIGFINID